MPRWSFDTAHRYPAVAGMGSEERGSGGRPSWSPAVDAALDRGVSIGTSRRLSAKTSRSSSELLISPRVPDSGNLGSLLLSGEAPEINHWRDHQALDLAPRGAAGQPRRLVQPRGKTNQLQTAGYGSLPWIGRAGVTLVRLVALLGYEGSTSSRRGYEGRAVVIAAHRPAPGPSESDGGSP